MMMMMQVYAVLREDWTGSGGGQTVCADGQATSPPAAAAAAGGRVIYTSTSNVVQVRLVTLQSAHFLIRVERNALHAR